MIVKKKKYGRSRDIISFYFSVRAIGMMLLAPEILFILGGKNYMEAKYVMTPVAMGCVCQFLYTLYVNIEQFKKKTLGMAVASVIAALLNYTLNALLIPQYGYIAAAYTTLAGYIFLLIVHMILVKKIGYAEFYDNKFIILVVIVMCIITLGINCLYENSIIRYIIISILFVSIMVVIFIKWENTKQLIKKIFK